MKKVLKVIILTSILFSTICFAADDNTFSNVTAGFSVTKPEGWHYLTAEQNIENIKRIQIDNDKLKQAILKNSIAPLVYITKYQEPFDDLNPSFKVNIKPLGTFKGVDPKIILKMISGQMQNILKEYKIVKKPTDTQISGLKAAYMTINSTAVVMDGREFPITSDFWIVPRDEFFFMIGTGTRQDEKTGTRAELMEIVKTIKIEK